MADRGEQRERAEEAVIQEEEERGRGAGGFRTCATLPSWTLSRCAASHGLIARASAPRTLSL